MQMKGEHFICIYNVKSVLQCKIEWCYNVNFDLEVDL